MANHKTKNKQQAKAVAVSWTDHAWEEYLWWQKNDPKIVEEINDLIEECRRDPMKFPTAKPEL